MKKRVYTTPEQKAEEMIRAGARPLEPFKDKDSPWLCECLTCGREITPRYSPVHRGQGACKYCAGRAVLAEEAEETLRAAGFEPLEPFPGAQTPWKSKCVSCGKESSPTYGNLKNGSTCRHCSKYKVAQARKISWAELLAALEGANLGLRGNFEYENHRQKIPVRCLTCEREVETTLFQLRQRGSGCPYCAGKKVDPVTAVNAMKEKGLVPLTDYPGSGTPWRCRCEGCGNEVTPTYGSIRAGQSGCVYCGQRVVDPDVAEKFLLEEKNLRPLEPYPGSAKPWRVLCLTCGREGNPAYANLRNGHGGCRYCADKGIDYSAAGYVYLVRHSEYKSFKIGIANSTPKKRHYDRLKQHERQGWLLVSRWEFSTANEAFEVEQAFLRWVRIELDLPQHLDTQEMPQGGATETFSSEGISTLDLKSKVSELAATLRR